MQALAAILQGPGLCSFVHVGVLRQQDSAHRRGQLWGLRMLTDRDVGQGNLQLQANDELCNPQDSPQIGSALVASDMCGLAAVQGQGTGSWALSSIWR